MRQLIHLLLFLLSASLFAQDTITVQTLTFSDITARRGTYSFPDTTHHYRKVLMLHTLKCDAATTQDQYPCGEWDYLTYHFVHEHTGQVDSIAVSHPFYLINAVAPDSTARLTTPLFDHLQRYSSFRAVDNVIDENDHPIGLNDASDGITLDASSGAARTQFVIAESELLGLGHVDAIRLFAQQAGASMDRLVIRMKNTTTMDLTSLDNNDLTTVFDHSVQLTGGSNTLPLLQPFTWAGAGNNILVDIAVDDQTPGATPVLNASLSAHPVLHAQREGHVRFHDGRVGVDPAAFASLDDQITITFRVFGDASLPVDNSIIEALDAEGNRVLNIHLPWSDGKVYWDAGGADGAGYDRVSKTATSVNIQGQWNYWAFTKDANSGIMKIYLNGNTWTIGSAKNIHIGTIVSFNIGSNGQASNSYPGELDDFNVFNTVLDQATIQAWMNKQVDSSHPQYANLLCSLPFNDAPTSFHVQDLASGTPPAWLLGRVQHLMTPATGITKGWQSGTIRPDLVLVEGDYTSHLDSTIATDNIIHTGIALETFAVNGNASVPVDTLFGWEGGMETTYLPDGSVESTTPVTGPFMVNHQLNYYDPPFNVVKDHEIGRYITPYGINLSLGSNGFTWVYDVTDYQYLLHDSVDISAGNQQELIDLKFLMIEGMPGRTVVNVVEPWGPQHSYSYGNLSNDSQLNATNVPLSPDAHQWALRSRITGHGDASSSSAQGCCEFKDNTHSLLVNGSTVDSWHIWQTNDCALNPVYPQGGTWLYSREGWCPGDIVKERTTELTSFVSGDSLNLDYGITPVPASNPGMAAGNYQMNMELFEFNAPTHQLDAEIYDVLRPSDAGYQSRENPICHDPVVVLRNAGGTLLTSATFTFGVSGGLDQQYTWTGSLKHMERTNVTLPIEDGNFWTGDNAHRFHVTVSAPNGGADEYADNDGYTTHFALPETFPANVVLNYKTNNRPQDNSLTVTDVYGNTVFSRNGMSANTTYHDTIQAGPGCFTLRFMDNGNDGLSYWADPGQGSGYFQVRNLQGALLKSFEPEFGHSIEYAFSIGSISRVDGLVEHPEFTAMPNPSNGRFTLRTNNVVGTVRITVLDGMGRLVRELQPSVYSGGITLDLSDQASGPYMVRLVTPDGVAMERVVKH